MRNEGIISASKTDKPRFLGFVLSSEIFKVSGRKMVSDVNGLIHDKGRSVWAHSWWGKLNYFILAHMFSILHIDVC